MFRFTVIETQRSNGHSAQEGILRMLDDDEHQAAVTNHYGDNPPKQHPDKPEPEENSDDAPPEIHGLA